MTGSSSGGASIEHPLRCRRSVANMFTVTSVVSSVACPAWELKVYGDMLHDTLGVAIAIGGSSVSAHGPMKVVFVGHEDLVYRIDVSISARPVSVVASSIVPPATESWLVYLSSLPCATRNLNCVGVHTLLSTAGVGTPVTPSPSGTPS